MGERRCASGSRDQRLTRIKGFEVYLIALQSNLARGVMIWGLIADVEIAAGVDSCNKGSSSNSCVG